MLILPDWQDDAFLCDQVCEIARFTSQGPLLELGLLEPGFEARGRGGGG